MPDIKVEKTFKDLTSSELFRQFCLILRTKELPKSYRENAPWTKLVRRIMREIGTSSGYQVNDHDLNGEWLTIDQTWRIHESSLIKTPWKQKTRLTSKM